MNLPIHLLNGSTEIRVRSSEGTTVLDCGCAYTEQPSRWIQMCDPDFQADNALHEQARLNHLAGELT